MVTPYFNLIPQQETMEWNHKILQVYFALGVTFEAHWRGSETPIVSFSLIVVGPLDCINLVSKLDPSLHTQPKAMVRKVRTYFLDYTFGHGRLEVPICDSASTVNPDRWPYRQEIEVCTPFFCLFH